MRRKIPSIEALQAFEAAARHQSFTRAAEELALTQSAVCKQIATLEEMLGIALFNRIKRRVSLSEAGQVYAREVREHLDRLERSTLSIMAHQGSGGVIELAAIPTFATRWLIPRLPGFYAEHPNITINITTRSDTFIFADTVFDASIHFGTGVWPGAHADHLFGEEMIPVCSPQLLARHPCPQPQDLVKLKLLHLSARHDAWHKWFAAAGASDLNAMVGPRYELFSMLVEAARAQMGVALVPRFLVQEEIRSGSLVTPFDIPMQSEMGYFLVYPESKQEAKVLQAFVSWLLEQAEQYRSQLQP
ncbi:transcriptional regulator GcvA [Pseudogulbenkiania ferrooxidans]|uniref:Transcriptional regulator, LysR family n=1 Tax=Pseudogulbenkiania ferrooxidans 2002 TaxID=279714 RepID=B9Z2C0_9NEIS|nr:transcriptional regulator GcvA [Pseudogulbenkiania ferrooxidans]EEG08723.1 transcriptional regulator, LysR family [Pseudogulbenkiania ferrooxidans 2002]